jgi:hypothetical protein
MEGWESKVGSFGKVFGNDFLGMIFENDFDGKKMKKTTVKYIRKEFRV